MKYLTSLILALCLSGNALAQVPVAVAADQQSLLQSKEPKLAANKRLVYEFIRQVLATRDVKLAPRYLAADYIQHNPNVPNGRKAFMDFFGSMDRQPLKATVDDLVSIVAEGDLVVLGFRQTLPDPKKQGETYTTTWFDMFRVGNGLIVEHWDYGTKG